MADAMSRTVPTPAGDVPIVPLALVLAGGYLAWFGVKYWDSGTEWPTDPIKAVLTGKSLPVPDRSGRQGALAAILGASQPGAVGTAAGGAAAVAGNALGTGTLTHAQLVQLWTSNGGNASTADTAAAIAQAESGGRTGVTSSNPDGGTNVGLWQLDTKGVGAGHTIQQLQDPTTNARITIMATANGTNWNQWETWHTGAYKQFL